MNSIKNCLYWSILFQLIVSPFAYGMKYNPEPPTPTPPAPYEYYHQRPEPKPPVQPHYEYQQSLPEVTEQAVTRFNQENNVDALDTAQEISTSDFYLRYDTELHTAVAVIECPSSKDLPPITKEESAAIREQFKAYSIKRQGKYCVVLFDYKDEKALPADKVQAALLLLSPYEKNVEWAENLQGEALANYQRPEQLLNAHQAKIISEEIVKKRNMHELEVMHDQEKSNKKAKKEISARDLLAKLNINTKQKKQHPTLNLEIAVDSIEHFLGIMNKSADPQQKILFAGVVSVLTEHVENSRTKELEKFTDLKSIDTGAKQQLITRIKDVLVTNGVMLSEESINQLFSLNPELLHSIYLIAELEIQLQQSDASQIAKTTNEWMQVVKKLIMQQHIGSENTTVEDLRYGSLHIYQLSTLVADAYCRRLRLEFEPSSFSTKQDLFLKELNILDANLLSKIKNRQAHFARFFNTVFKSDVIDGSGQIRTMQDYAQQLNLQFEEIKRKALEEGIALGTLIKTNAGYKKAEDFYEQEFVTSFNQQSQSQTQQKITCIERAVLNRYIEIKLQNNKTIFVGVDERFKINGKWVKARDILQSKELQQAFPIPIAEINLVKEKREFIKLTIEGDHSFYITEDDILVHNAFVISIDVFFEWGVRIFEGLEWVMSVYGPTIYATGSAAIAWAGYQLWNKKNKDTREKQEKTPKAPGVPTAKDGFVPPKNWNGQKVPHPKSGQYGYPDNKGNVWVPTGQGGAAHGGPHWDVVGPNGEKKADVFPGGKIR